MSGFVYRWTNLVNGHWYVGSHQGTEDDGYVGSGVAFCLAYRKYGPQSFVREILYRGDEFRQVETNLLRSTDAMNDPNSYNIINDANAGFAGRRHTLTAREQISKSLSGESNPMFGKRGEASPTFGLRGYRCSNSKLTPEQVKRIRDLLAVGQFTDRKIGEQFGVSKHTIRRIRLGYNYIED